MQPRRVFLVALIVVGFGLAWFLIDRRSPKDGGHSSANRSGEDPSPAARITLRGQGTSKEAVAESQQESEAAPPRPSRSAKRRRSRQGPALDVRLVAPAGHERPSVVRTALLSDHRLLGVKERRPDEQGRLRIPVASAQGHENAVLILDAPGFAWIQLAVPRLHEDEVHYHGDLLLDPGRTVTGRLVDGEGRGVENVDVWVTLPDVPRILHGLERREGRTGKGGTFRIDQAPTGPAVLRSSHHRYATRSVTVPAPSGPVEVRAWQGGFVWGSIGQKSGGGCMTLLRILPVAPTVGEPREGSSDEYGRVRLAPLPPGSYRVIEAPTWREPPRLPGDPPAEPEPEIEFGTVTVKEGEYTTVHWTHPGFGRSRDPRDPPPPR